MVQDKQFKLQITYILGMLIENRKSYGKLHKDESKFLKRLIPTFA